MRTRSLLFAVMLSAFACKPKPTPVPPPPGDTTTVSVDSTPAWDADTTPATADDTLLPPLTGHRSAPPPVTGMRSGLSNWTSSNWCKGPFNSTFYQADPRFIGGLVRKAAYCGFSFLGITPRPLITENGNTVGRYSASKHLDYIRAFAKAFPNDSVIKYKKTLRGLSLIDDPGCADCWGGTVVAQADVAAAARLAKQLIPALAVGGRVPMTWYAAYQPWREKTDTAMDFAWEQYRKMYGDVDAFFAGRSAMAAKYGIKIGRGVNVLHCVKAGYPPACTAAEIRTFNYAALTAQPTSVLCLNNSWQWDAQVWTAADQTAWKDVIAKAATLPEGDCHR